MNPHQPTWQELRDLHATSRELYVSGAMEHRYIKHDGSLDQGTWTFQHGPGHRWRIERSGQVQYIRDGDTAYARFDDGMRTTHADKTRLAALLPISPLRFLGGTASILTDLTTDAEPTFVGPTTVAGRSAWQIRLAVGTDHDSTEIDFDQETGLVLGLRGLDGKLTAAMTEVRVGDQIPDDAFTWEGPTAPSRLIERTSATQIQQLREIPASVPRYWPTGVGYIPRAGDPDTGELILSLEVDGAPILARWPLNAHLTLLDQLLVVGHPHQADWSDEKWHWRLLTRAELSPPEIERIRKSMQ